MAIRLNPTQRGSSRPPRTYPASSLTKARDSAAAGTAFTISTRESSPLQRQPGQERGTTRVGLVYRAGTGARQAGRPLSALSCPGAGPAAEACSCARARTASSFLPVAPLLASPLTTSTSTQSYLQDTPLNPELTNRVTLHQCVNYMKGKRYKTLVCHQNC